LFVIETNYYYYIWASWTRCNDIYKILGVFLSRLDLGLDFGVGLREEERDHLLIVFGCSLYFCSSCSFLLCLVNKEGRKEGRWW
jgi:hypothetical protein